MRVASLTRQIAGPDTHLALGVDAAREISQFLVSETNRLLRASDRTQPAEWQTLHVSTAHAPDRHPVGCPPGSGADGFAAQRAGVRARAAAATAAGQY